MEGKRDAHKNHKPMNGEREPLREYERRVAHAWLFDIDGVLTDPLEKKVTQPAVLAEIYRRLLAGEPVALNTGRSSEFITNRVLKELEKMILDKQLLQGLCAIGEKGALSIVYDEKGARHEMIDESISIPKVLQDAVRMLVEEQFADVMFYDTTKKTMVTAEMNEGVRMDIFKQRQEELNRELERLLVKHGLEGSYTIDSTRIATDIQHKNAGKALGADRFLQWLKWKGLAPEQVVAFGDSRSDVDMAEEVHKSGLPVEFVFVGDRALLQDKQFSFEITFTHGQFEEGVLEYLQEHPSEQE